MGEILPENWNGRIQILCSKSKDFLENLDDVEIWVTLVLQKEDVSVSKIHGLLVWCILEEFKIHSASGNQNFWSF